MEPQNQLNGNDVKQRTMDVSVAEEFTFKKFMLSERLLKTLENLQFIKPSPVQLKILPLCRCTFDMIIQAKSGTGKTLGFSICLLENYNSDLKFPSILVVVPTRELAVQIVNVLNDLGKSIKNFKAESFIGGTDLGKDRIKIQSTKVVVGTPGRILHLVKNDVFNISNLKTIVLDESDKLLESGQMAKDVTGILKMTRNKVQIIAATATVSSHMENVLKQFMRNPIGITPKHEIPVLLGIKQFVHVLPKEADNIKLMKAKIVELQKVFDRITFKQCLLFTDSQNKTESYGNYLNAVGWKNEVINGSQEQSHRLDVLAKLIKFQCRIIISTDLMARGIDIENINLIINLDLPHDCFTYLHRIGRAGRYGSYGIAITFVHGEDELEKFEKMVREIGGPGLNVMRYPEDSVSHDFWNFQNENNLVSILEPSIGETDDENTLNDTMVNNLALLNITSKLIDYQDERSNQNEFNLDALLDDYEQTLTELAGEKNKIKDENTTLNCGLIVESEKQLLKEEHHQVIFKRTNEETVDYETTSESCSSDTDISDHESHSEDSMNQNEIQADASQASKTTYNPYSEFVSSNYLQWENIYNFQLANMQNYLKMSKK